jgi:hypothetical protein
MGAATKRWFGANPPRSGSRDAKLVAGLVPDRSRQRERKTINVKYYAADVGPAIGAIGRLVVLIARVFGQGPWVGVAILVLLIVAFAVWYVGNRMRNGEATSPPPVPWTPSSAKSSTGNRGSDYFKKCPACGKFTRDAKVCRICGHDLNL